jgi:hypothetical protein
MMDYEQFPGCCGAFVLYEFDDLSNADDSDEDGWDNTRADMIQEFHDSISSCGSGKLICATLIDSQLHQGWLSILHKAGFKRVARWTNNNHGNVCNLFTMYKGNDVSPPYRRRMKKAKAKPVAERPGYAIFESIPF